MRRMIPFVYLMLLGACTTTPPPPKQVDVFFQVNSAKLTPEAQQVVEAILPMIRDTKPSSIVVEGEADGTSPRDAQLADQRASTVGGALRAAGADQAKHVQPAP